MIHFLHSDWSVHIFPLSPIVFQAVKKRPDLKLIVTSATLDAVKFSSYFYEAVSNSLQLVQFDRSFNLIPPFSSLLLFSLLFCFSPHPPTHTSPSYTHPSLLRTSLPPTHTPPSYTHLTLLHTPLPPIHPSLLHTPLPPTYPLPSYVTPSLPSPLLAHLHHPRPHTSSGHSLYQGGGDRLPGCCSHCCHADPSY